MRNLYTALDVDRCDARRGDTAWIEQQMRSASSRTLLVWRGRNLTSAHDGSAIHEVITAEIVDRFAADAFTLLGVADGAAFFGLDVSSVEDPIADLGLRGTAVFEDLRRIGPVLPRREGALLAHARAMAHWHSRHLYCGACGAPTRPARAGHVRVCSDAACGIEHFPRTDPAVITLVTHEDACLLGRQARWRPNMFSVLAGFVEPGEDLEQAVVREVFEEAGVAVTDVRYHSSQPWPFPASLMIGFTARATSRELNVDGSELELARWLTRDDIFREVEAGTLVLSPVDSISRRLVDEWLEERL